MNKPLIIFQGIPFSQGVYYFRIKQFYDKLVELYSHQYEFKLIDRPFNLDDLDELKRASIVQTHKHPICDGVAEYSALQAIKENGGKLVIDHDDHYLMHHTHPKYSPQENRVNTEVILSWIASCDAVTVASKNLKTVFDKHHKNVVVIENTYNPQTEQFIPKNVEKPSRLTIGYVAGSSHKNDISLLDGVVNNLMSDSAIKDKVRFLTAGYDTRGTKMEVKINDDFAKELGKHWTQNVFNSVRASNGNIDLVTGIPEDIKEKYRYNYLLSRELPIMPHDTPYYVYEQVLTDNYKLIKGEDQQAFIDNYSLKEDLHLELLSRVWTKPVEEFCNVYDLCDIVIAPLQKHYFNEAKSDLKFVEASSRSIPVVASSMAPYNVIGRSEENCLLIDPSRPNASKYWYKALKRLIQDGDLRARLGKQLHDDVLAAYDINLLTKRRIDLYENLITKLPITN